MCRVVDTLLVDQETIYAPRQGNDRLLLGLKGSLNEYELDLLRQRSLAARHEKARRGELIVMAPVGYLKTDDQRLEKDPDQRVQEAISLVFAKFWELGSAPLAMRQIEQRFDDVATWVNHRIGTGFAAGIEFVRGHLHRNYPASCPFRHHHLMDPKSATGTDHGDGFTRLDARAAQYLVGRRQ